MGQLKCIQKIFLNECDIINKKTRYEIICRFPQLYENRMESKNAKLLGSSFLVFYIFLFTFSIIGTIAFSNTSHKAGIFVCFIS